MPTNRKADAPFISMPRLLLWICLAVAVPCFGQSDDEDDKVYKADNFGFNALDVYQRRFFIEDKVQYEKGKGLLDYLSVGVGAQFDQIVPRIELPFLMSKGGNLFLEKEIDRLHALQIGMSWGVYEKTHSKYFMNKTSMELAHYFNWSRFFKGYDPMRLLSFSSSTRIGGFSSQYRSGMRKGLTGSIGIRGSLMLTPTIYLHAEPYFGVASDKVDFSGTENFHHYDVTYGLTASLSYLIKGNKYAAEYRSGYQRFFLDYSMGALLGLNSSMHPWKGMGPSMGVGAGYWFDHHFGVRLKGYASKNMWREYRYAPQQEAGHPAYQLMLSNLQCNGHLDLMVNLNSFFPVLQEFPLGINVLAGWQFGWITKHDIDSTDVKVDNEDVQKTLLSCDNNGFSMGIQLYRQYSDALAFYVEPRLTFCNYKIPYLPPYEDIVERYSDVCFNLNFGIEMGVAPSKMRKKTKSEQAESLPRREMRFGLAFGPGTTIYTKQYKGGSGMQYIADANMQYSLTAHSGLRIGLGLTQINNSGIRRYSETMDGVPYLFNGLWHCKYKHLNLSTEYICNLTTLFNGYDEQHRFSASAGIGPVLSFLMSESGMIDNGELLFGESLPILKNEQNMPICTLGGQLSMQLHYKITNHFGVYAEERVRIYNKRFIAGSQAGMATRMLFTQIGLTYTL